MKRLCLFLAVLLTFALVSCGDSANNPNENQVNPDNNQAADNNLSAEPDSIESEPERIRADVPDEWDFNGHEFTILANGTAYNSYWYSKDIWVEEETGDLINDAVYARNRAIEEKYNIEINGVFTGDQYNMARRDIIAGDNTYDMFSVALQGPTARLAQEGLLLDLKHVPYIDL